MNFPRRLLFHFFNLFFCTFTFHVTFTVFGVLLLFNSTFSSPYLRHSPDQTFYFPLSLSSISRYPFGHSRSTHRLVLLKKKKNLSFGSYLFPLRSTEISRKWKYSKKKKKKKKEQLEVSCNIS